MTAVHSPSPVLGQTCLLNPYQTGKEIGPCVHFLKEETEAQREGSFPLAWAQLVSGRAGIYKPRCISLLSSPFTFYQLEFRLRALRAVT